MRVPRSGLFLERGFYAHWPVHSAACSWAAVSTSARTTSMGGRSSGFLPSRKGWMVAHSPHLWQSARTWVLVGLVRMVMWSMVSSWWCVGPLQGASVRGGRGAVVLSARFELASLLGLTYPLVRLEVQK